MRILFTADWHIKLTSKNIPFEWQWNRFIGLFHAILEHLKEHDILVIGGDIFDTEPNVDEIALFLEFYKHKCLVADSKPVIVYSGNHDLYAKRKESFLSKLCSSLPDLIYVDKPTSLYGMDIVPYHYISKIETINPTNKILLTHVRGEIPPHVKPEINLDLLTGWPLVLAGDLHDYSNSQRNIVYPGSPLTTHFNKSKTTKGFISVNSDTLEHKFVKLEIPQLIRLEIESEMDVVEDDFHHYEFILKGTQQELAQVVSTKVKKKITSLEKSDAKLDLMATSSITEELEIYFKQVMKFDDSRIKNIIHLFDEGLDA